MDQIFKHIDLAACIVSQVDSNATLGCLARTSHTISKIALNRLWHSIDSVVVLARCMPPEFWEEFETFSPSPVTRGGWCGTGRRRGVYTSKINLSAEKRAPDWLGERFVLYASRIRSLSTEHRSVDRNTWPIQGSSSSSLLSSLPAQSHYLNYYVTSSVHPQVYLAWDAYSRDIKPLFPNLVHLRWAAHGALDADLIALLSVPSLRHLTFRTPDRHPTIFADAPAVDHASDWVAAVVNSCLASGVKLHSLDLLGVAIDVTILESTFHEQLQHLTAFCCSVPLPDRLIRYMATLPNLKSLHVLVNPGLKLHDIPRAFPALSELGLGHIPWDVARTYVSTIHSNYLRALELSLVPMYEHEAWLQHVIDLFYIIGTHTSTRLLQKLSLKGCPTSKHMTLEQPRKKHTASPIAIRHILGLSHLKHLELDEPYTDPEFPVIPAMLRSLTQLKILKVCGSESVYLDQFVEILHELPSIETLAGVKVDCDLHVPLPVSPGYSHTSLIWIKFRVMGGYADVAAKQSKLAHYLLNTFPSVQDHCTDSYEVNQILQDSRSKSEVILKE